MSCCFYLRYPRSAPALLVVLYLSGAVLSGLLVRSPLGVCRLMAVLPISSLHWMLDESSVWSSKWCYLPNVIGRFLPCGVGGQSLSVGAQWMGEK